MSDQETSKAIISICAGTCPDEVCQSVVGFKPGDLFVTCLRCGQTHDINRILNIFVIEENTLGFKSILRTLLLSRNPNLRKDSDTVKVNGLSNCHGKLLSPLFTEYGMDKVTLKAKPLSEMTSKPIFDCGLLGDRNFTICREHLDVPGFGRDSSGSDLYLGETLKMIEEANGNKEVLVPLHADGDGHCLVHAVSRALTGRNLFWHPLRSHLKRHLIEKRADYEMLLAEFINTAEWDDIINECDPNFEPDDTKGEGLGLRNVHIFGLANILKRPIILFDSLAGMRSCGDYSAVFLPSLAEPEECKSKAGELNSPICIAWSNGARVHFIPLVGLRDDNPPAIPVSTLPAVWVVSRSRLSLYMNFTSDGTVLINGKLLNEAYIGKLVNCMNELFLEKYGVHPLLLSERNPFNYRRPLASDMATEVISSQCRRSIQEHRLYRCVECLTLNLSPVLSEWLRPGNNGLVYNKAKQKYGMLIEGFKYVLPEYNVVCHYNSKKDFLILEGLLSQKCRHCYSSHVRLVQNDGTVSYENGDITPRRSFSNHCLCGYKHFYDGKEYENPPQMITVWMNLNQRTVVEDVPWFQFESDMNLNSNVYEVANATVQKHFPGHFGTEYLVRRVVNQLLATSKRIDEKTCQVKSNQLPMVYIPDEVIDIKDEKVESTLQECSDASTECDTSVTAVIKLPDDEVVKNEADSSVSSNLHEFTDETETLDLQQGEKVMFVEEENDITKSKLMIVEEEMDNTGNKPMFMEEQKDNTGNKPMFVEEQKDNTGSKFMFVEEEKDATGSTLMFVEEDKYNTGSKLTFVEEGKDATGSKLVFVKEEKNDTGSKLMFVDEEKDDTGNKLKYLDEEKDNVGSKLMFMEEEKENTGSKLMFMEEEKENTGSKLMFVEEEKDDTVSTSGDATNFSFLEDLRQAQLDMQAQQNEFKLKKMREVSGRSPGADFIELMTNPDYSALVNYGPNAANIRRAWEEANRSSSTDSVQNTFQEDDEQSSTTVRIGPGYSVLAPKPGDGRSGLRTSRGPRSGNSAHGEADSFVGGGPSRNRGSLSARTRFRIKHRD